MAITSIDGIVNGLGNNAQHLIINKASISTQVAGGFTSLWRATGTPAQGAIPAAAAICNKSLTGAFGFNNPSAGICSYIARLMMLSSNSATDVQVHDRLAHMGGLNGTLTTAQTVGVDASDSSLDLRRGDSAYSDVQWWLEWYTATGSTAVTATISYTNDAGVSGKTTTVSIAVSLAASRMLPIIGAGGEFIKSIQSVTLSATTATAGSFGVTATRALCGLSLGLANSSVIGDWAAIGFPKVPDDSCLMLIMIPGATTSGTLYGTGKIIQG